MDKPVLSPLQPPAYTHYMEVLAPRLVPLARESERCSKRLARAAGASFLCVGGMVVFMLLPIGAALIGAGSDTATGLSWLGWLVCLLASHHYDTEVARAAGERAGRMMVMERILPEEVAALKEAKAAGRTSVL